MSKDTISSIAIVVFSGTGNTLVAAELLAAVFEKQSITVDMFTIKELLNRGEEITLDQYDLVGIGHPVHGFEAPRPVYDLVRALPEGRNQRIFILKTAADFARINNAASKTLIRKLEARGYDVFYERLICMASNWLVKYDDDLAKQLYLAAKDKAQHMCQDLLAGKRFMLPANVFHQAFARFVHLGETLGARLWGKGLTVSDACIDCDTCIRECPTDNIRRIQDNIAFGWACTSCMHCVYACPTHAISARFLNLLILDEYNIQAVIDNPELRGEYLDQDTSGYYKRFLEYLDDPSL